jgi:hypothetical protein
MAENIYENLDTLGVTIKIRPVWGDILTEKAFKNKKKNKVYTRISLRNLK